jgi:hypothetical protein
VERTGAVHDHRLVLGIASVAVGAWCGWASGFHRTAAAAEITWLVTLAAVVLFDVWLWRGSTVGRPAWFLEPAREPWPRPSRGGNRPALRGVVLWLALILVVLAWEVLGIDSGPHQYHLTISALAQAYRPMNAALLLVWVLIGVGYEAARLRAPIQSGRTRLGDQQPEAPDHGGAYALAMGSVGAHHGAPALLLPQSPPAGVAFWVLVPIAAVLIDQAARRSHGGRADAEEFIRFISTSRLANDALIAAWAFAGYHLFAR